MRPQYRAMLDPAVLAVSLFLLFFFFGSTHAAEVHGSVDAGMWGSFNNLSDDSRFVEDDGVGDSYVVDRYTLMMLGLDLDATDLMGESSPYRLNAHVKGKSLINLENESYTLGVSNHTRQQMDELNVESVGVGGVGDVWLGRQLLLEAGGVGLDGARGIYHFGSKTDVALFGGLGNDPRNLTGYIGPAYRTNPFTANFQVGGAYFTYRGDDFKTDSSLYATFYKGKTDRATVYTQNFYQLNSTWSFSGLIQANLVGRKALESLAATASTRPTSRITNTLSLSRYEAWYYRESLASAIPVPTGISTAPVGTDVTSASYNSAREHLMYRIFERNYVFGAFQFTRRTYDDRNQLKYTVGYRDPKLLGSDLDLLFQTDLIDNYQGFNTRFDTLLGKDFSGGEIRLEGGMTYFANERDVYLGFAPTTAPRQTDKEYTARFNAYYTPYKELSWFLNYSLSFETDATNTDQKIRTHDVYVATKVRF